MPPPRANVRNGNRSLFRQSRMRREKCGPGGNSPGQDDSPTKSNKGSIGSVLPEDYPPKTHRCDTKVRTALLSSYLKMNCDNLKHPHRAKSAPPKKKWLTLLPQGTWPQRKCKMLHPHQITC
jgi:hypothetical protein